MVVLSLFVLTGGGEGGGTLVFGGRVSLCFLCLLCFHPVTLSPIFFENQDASFDTWPDKIFETGTVLKTLGLLVAVSTSSWRGLGSSVQIHVRD